MPRMADFARCAAAWELRFWPKGTFMAAYEGNRQGAIDNVLDADLVAGAVLAMMVDRTEWNGTATDLIEQLAKFVSETQRNSKAWPTSGRAVAGKLRRSEPFLRKIGIEFVFSRSNDRARTRLIQIISKASSPDPATVSSSASSASSDAQSGLQNGAE
jgi:hypothetical protein